MWSSNIANACCLIDVICCPSGETQFSYGFARAALSKRIANPCLWASGYGSEIQLNPNSTTSRQHRRAQRAPLVDHKYPHGIRNGVTRDILLTFRLSGHIFAAADLSQSLPSAAHTFLAAQESSFSACPARAKLSQACWCSHPLHPASSMSAKIEISYTVLTASKYTKFSYL